MVRQASELILNPDGSIYHLNILPEDLAPTVILVGDPDRVNRVSRYFDRIDVRKSKREFITHTGWYRGNRISVISTGIGTDNIDIVLNELDALVNLDLKNGQPFEELTQLELIRVGTSGAIHPDIPVDAFVLSELAMGFDGLLHYYNSGHVQLADLQFNFMEYCGWSVLKPAPYAVRANKPLCDKLYSNRVINGFTATCSGFYGPQVRALRLDLEDPQALKTLSDYSFDTLRITNMEMETAGIFGLAALMGHAAASLNCILANRVTGEFSRDPQGAIDELILYALEKLTSQA
jgi:uridine phosphorylase